jgi:NitT/TauT family transport system permease protein
VTGESGVGIQESGYERRRPATRAASRRLARIAIGIVPIVLVIIGWWLLALQMDRQRIYPTPDVIVEDVITILRGEGALGNTYVHVAATLLRLFAAFVFAMVVGSLVGLVAGRSRSVFALIENVVWVFMAVPSIVWVFIFAVALGTTNVVPVAAMAALLTPMVLINVAEGAKAVPDDLLAMSRSYKVSAWDRVTGIYLPHLVPYVTSSARTAFALGIKLVVVAEVIGLAVGVGYEINYWYDRVFMSPIIAWGIVMIAIGLAVDGLVFGPLERRAGRWRPVSIHGAALEGAA